MGGRKKMADSVTYIGFVQDHSGSMSSNAQLAKDNFNEQRAKLLKEDDDTMDNLVTIVEFDDEIHCNADNMPITEVKELDKWWTGGMTALYDAIAFCINNIKQKMDADNRTDKAALIVVQTDGAENQSSDYAGEEGRKRINKLINELEETKLWTFVFLGENIDEEVAMDMGFKMSNIMKHGSGQQNVATAYACSTQGLDKFSKMRKRGETYTMNYFGDGDQQSNDNNS
jgi:uncharacterized protein YegL